ncbi:unnamed protein product [Pseudo-nitzschia multistriata]|uniref:Secreted protein n=1 Tax=Pseudo-nitzschia multistriata TaxID=183589 RepID=A0A448Z6D1_9STRA|nr:unnamed protein product [Pseudo-nitzschia multistriata]
MFAPPSYVFARLDLAIYLVSLCTWSPIERGHPAHAIVDVGILVHQVGQENGGSAFQIKQQILAGLFFTPDRRGIVETTLCTAGSEQGVLGDGFDGRSVVCGAWPHFQRFPTDCERLEVQGWHVGRFFVVCDAVFQLDAEADVVVRRDTDFRAVGGVGSFVWLLRIDQWRCGADRVGVADDHVSLLSPEIKGAELVGPKLGVHARLLLLDPFFRNFLVVVRIVEDFLMVHDSLVLQSVLARLVAFAGDVHSLSSADHLERPGRPGKPGTPAGVGFTVEESRRLKDDPFSLEFLPFLENVLVVGLKLVLVVSNPAIFSHRFHLGLGVKELVSGSLVDYVFRVVVVDEFELWIVGVGVRIYWFLFFVIRRLCGQRGTSVVCHRLPSD